MATFYINQKAWFVARDNFKNHTIEYLDHDRDVFYLEGVAGYATKAEAYQRLDKYRGSLIGVFVQGPNYGRYSIQSRSVLVHQSFNTFICRLQIMDKMVAQDKGDAEELRRTLHDFAIAEGIWSFSGLPKMKEFLMLCCKYDALSEKELARLIYDFQK